MKSQPTSTPNCNGRPVAIRLVAAVLLCLAGPAISEAVELSLSPGPAYLWAGATAVASYDDLLIVGSPNGLRFFHEDALGSFELIGQQVTPVGVVDLVLHNAVVYYVGNDGVLRILDITDPESPVDLGTVPTPHSSRFLGLCGGYVISIGDGHVSSYNLSDPQSPAFAAEWSYSGTVYQVAWADSLFFLSQGTDGLLAVVVHSDGSFSPAGTYTGVPSNPPLTILEAATNGAYAWIPAGQDGVLVADFRDPAAPTTAARIVTYGDARHVSVDGDRLLIADATYGLLSYRVTVPEIPYFEDELNSLTAVERLWAGSASRFYETSGKDVAAIDIGRLGSISVGGRFSRPGGYGDIARYNDWGIFCDRDGVWRMDGLTADAESSFVRLYQGSCYDVQIRGNRIFLSEGGFGVTVGDIDSLARITPRVQIPARSQATGTAFYNDTVVVIEDGYGFTIYDISNPAFPDFLGLKRRARDFNDAVLLNGRYLCLSTANEGVTLYDLRFPVKPREIGPLPGALDVKQLTLMGNLLYAADAARGVLIYSVADPSDPVLISQLSQPATASALCLSGRTLYVGNDQGQITALDHPDPYGDDIIATAQVSVAIAGIRKFGERLWVTTESAVHVVDVTPALTPGDFLCDGFTDALDMTALIDYLFANGLPSYRPNAADASGDGIVNGLDIDRLVDFLFSNSPPLGPGHVE
jgi:hypothetical protein